MAWDEPTVPHQPPQDDPTRTMAGQPAGGPPPGRGTGGPEGPEDDWFGRVQRPLAITLVVIIVIAVLLLIVFVFAGKDDSDTNPTTTTSSTSSTTVVQSTEPVTRAPVTAPTTPAPSTAPSTTGSPPSTLSVPSDAVSTIGT
jgi:hypothetical protein